MRAGTPALAQILYRICSPSPGTNGAVSVACLQGIHELNGWVRAKLSKACTHASTTPRSCALVLCPISSCYPPLLCFSVLPRTLLSFVLCVPRTYSIEEECWRNSGLEELDTGYDAASVMHLCFPYAFLALSLPLPSLHHLPS
jgi:hypothetical protein